MCDFKVYNVGSTLFAECWSNYVDDIVVHKEVKLLVIFNAASITWNKADPTFTCFLTQYK